ncbi:hypothetical protein [Desulfonauticus submarinus]
MFLKKLFKRKTKEKLEQYQEAITFAEAGDKDTASKILNKEDQTISKDPMLLVIGDRAKFSSEVIEYSLDMAKRMGYKILALNTAPLSENGVPLSSSAKKELIKTFTEKSEKSFLSFAQKAKANGVDIEHKILFEDKETALEHLKQQNIPIEFVISDIERDFVANDNRPENCSRVCVYSLC